MKLNSGLPLERQAAYDASFSKLLKELGEVFDEGYVGWNGRDDVMVLPCSLFCALTLAVHIPFWMPETEVCVEPDGEICFTWCWPGAYRFSVSTSQNLGRLPYAWINGFMPKVCEQGLEKPPTRLNLGHGVCVFNFKEFPVELLRVIEAISAAIVTERGINSADFLNKA